MPTYFAEIGTNNRVKRVVVVNDSFSPNGADWCTSVYGGTWRETKTDGSIYGLYASVGFRYDTLNSTYVAQPISFPSTFPVTSSCFMGDSIVANMAGAPSLSAPLNSTSNLGVSGYTIGQIAGQVGSIGSASHVFLEGGTNDLFGNGSGAPIMPTYKSILNSIPQTKKVVIVGIPPVDEVQLIASWGPTGPNVLNNTNIASYNAQLTAYCAGWVNCVIATQAIAMNMTGKTSDGIHIKSANYAEWTSRIAAALA